MTEKVSPRTPAAEVVIKCIETGEPIVIEDPDPIGTQIENRLTPERAKMVVEDKLDDLDAHCIGWVFGDEVDR